MLSSQCFLCDPDPNLVVSESPAGLAMVGYGPITETYCILAASIHIRSLADLAAHARNSMNQLLAMRTQLEVARGPLLMTEHGRVPICRNDADAHDPHCFHGHALLFSTSVDVERHAATYYRHVRVFSDPIQAFRHAETTSEYFLVSQNARRYSIFSEPLAAPRQLARTLVAFQTDALQYADWRDSPREDEALAMARKIRRSISK